MNRRGLVGARFGAAAASYDGAAALQRVVAQRLAGRIAGRFPDPQAAPRILEIGCGTGLLTRALRRSLPAARIVATDLSPRMAASCRAAVGDVPVLAMDGAVPAVAGGWDVVCSSLALQWFDDPLAALAGWRGLLAPGGAVEIATLADGTLPEWRASHVLEGVADGGLDLPATGLLRGAGGVWQGERVAIAHADGLDFLRGLRRIGATLAPAGRMPLGPGRLRAVLRRFEAEHGAVASYQVAYGSLSRPSRAGVFVTGTDTEIGKTLVSACLVRAWGAEYWKPMQTGLDADPGDSATVARLAGLGPERVHSPAVALRAPLSPEDAAALEGRALDTLPSLPPAIEAGRPLVVEGAGGVLVPIGPGLAMVELIARLGLPVVLVARSTLGTINHTLLSLEALRARGIAVAGVVLNGPLSPGNAAAIARHGGVRILAQLTPQALLDPVTVSRLAGSIPDLASLQ